MRNFPHEKQVHFIINILFAVMLVLITICICEKVVIQNSLRHNHQLLHANLSSFGYEEAYKEFGNVISVEDASYLEDIDFEGKVIYCAIKIHDDGSITVTRFIPRQNLWEGDTIISVEVFRPDETDEFLEYLTQK